MSNSQALGNALSRARRLYSVSITELARELGITTSAVNAFESGEKIPTDVVLQAYATRFRMELGELRQLAGDNAVTSQ